MIALDANGADGGPATVAEGARLLGRALLLFGPASELAGADGVVDAPVRIAADEEPVRAVRRSPDASIVQAAEGGGRRARRGARVRRQHGAHARGGHREHQAHPRRAPPGARRR